MKNSMTNEVKADAPATNQTATSEDLVKTGPSANSLSGNQPSKESEPAKEPEKKEVNLDDYIPKTQYQDLENKFNEEKGEYQTFYNDLSPLLDKLQDQPEIVEAIMEDKIDSKLAAAVLEGKVAIAEAKAVSEAHQEVKEELGKKAYEKATPEEIDKLVEAKVSSIISKLKDELKGDISKVETTLSVKEERKEFESNVDEFVKNTPDLVDYVQDIDQWFTEHPDQYDIEIAYDAVKGKKSREKVSKDAEEKAAEMQKEMALNAGGGHSQGTQIPQEKDIVDKFVSRKANPNVF